MKKRFFKFFSRWNIFNGCIENICIRICIKLITGNKSFRQNRFGEILEIVLNIFYGAQESTSSSNRRGSWFNIVRSWFNIDTTIHASRNLWCNLRISVKTRRDMDITEMATANTRSDMNAAVNMKTSWGKSLEMLPQFTIK